jgi:hypothetical protein
MSRIKDQRFKVAGKEREKDWQNCGHACNWGGGGSGSAERIGKIPANCRVDQLLVYIIKELVLKQCSKFYAS